MEIYLPPWILLPLPGWISICQVYKRVCQKLHTKANFLINKCCIKKARFNLSMRYWTLHFLQHRFSYPYSQIYSARGLKSIQCWNQCLKYYSSSTFKWRHNLSNFIFLVEIFPHTRYGVRDVARVLLFMVQLEKLYSMHPLQCYITGTWLNPMMSKFTENWCWCHFFLPLMTIMYDHQNLS